MIVRFFISLITIGRTLVEWSGGHSTPKGKRGKDETPQAKMRWHLPPRGKRVGAAQ